MKRQITLSDELELHIIEISFDGQMVICDLPDYIEEFPLAYPRTLLSGLEPGWYFWLAIRGFPPETQIQGPFRSARKAQEMGIIFRSSIITGATQLPITLH